MAKRRVKLNTRTVSQIDGKLGYFDKGGVMAAILVDGFTSPMLFHQDEVEFVL